MAKYKKRKDGRYCTHITIGYDTDGKRIRKPIYALTIKELEAKLADFKSLQNKGVVVCDTKTTLSEWAEKWLSAYKKGVSYNTYEMYRMCVENHIITADIADIPLIKIKTVDLQHLINEKLASGLTRTVEIVILTLRQMFDQAVENDLLYKSPATGLKKPTRQVKPKRALTDIENKAIENAKLSDRERAFVYLGKYAGLRRGEILALTRGDISLDKKIVSVNKTIIFKGNDGEVKPMPKSAAGFRTIPIPDILYLCLKSYLNKLDGLPLFNTVQSNNVCTKSAMRKLWDAILKKLNTAAGSTDKLKVITDLTPHILRHDYATNLYYAGVDIKTAQKLLGHSDIKMTLQIYTHLEQDNESITDKLNTLFGNQNGSQK